jgi:hypothetical protein
VLVTHAAGIVGDAIVELLGARGLLLDRAAVPASSVAGATLAVNRCPTPRAPEGAPLARFAASPAATGALLPRTCLRARMEAPGYAPSEWVAAGDLGRPEAAAHLAMRAGHLRWHVTDRTGAPVPARLIVRGVAPTPDPDWGEDPRDGAALDAVHALGDGEIAIPPGRYGVVVSRGLEYTAREQTIAVEADRTVAIDAPLERVVDTSGWISADLHVHAVPSYDAPTLLADRVRSLAAMGVEVAAATDHNRVTDYGPTIRELGAGKWLTSIVGDEITTREPAIGHFNAFPLAAGSDPVPYLGTTPHDIFSAAHAAEPRDRDKVVQINHPRMGTIGHFELLRFDPSDVEGWRARSPLFDASFDAFEVFNGDDYTAIERVEEVLRDWYALLDAGVRATATGNSDSHKLTYHEPGVPRNFVRVPSDDPAAFDERAFIEAVRRGRVVVSSGPFVRLRAGDADVGDEVAPGDTDVHVRVEAPPWVDVTSVQLVRRGDVVREWRVHAAGTVRLDASATVPMKSGDWLIAVVRGEAPMTMLHRPGAKPFAFTNPIRAR